MRREVRVRELHMGVEYAGSMRPEVTELEFVHGSAIPSMTIMVVDPRDAFATMQEPSGLGPTGSMVTSDALQECWLVRLRGC